MDRRLLITAFALLVAAGCDPVHRGDPADRRSPATAASQPALPDNKRLAERAQTYWDDQVREDWPHMFYNFIDPPFRRERTVDQYIEFMSKREVFKINSFKLGRVESDGPFGWSEVDYNTSNRLSDQIPARNAKTWTKWRVVEGEWYPVPREMLEDYPAAPSTRNLVDEPALKARVEAAYMARQATDWKTVWDEIDPAAHETSTYEKFTSAISQKLFGGFVIDWIEATGNQARVRILFQTKPNDPSMTKMPWSDEVMIERWKKIGDSWYMVP